MEPEDLITGDARAAFIGHGRDMLDWLEARPDVPIHRYCNLGLTVYASWLDDEKHQIVKTSPKRLMRAMGSCGKNAYGGQFVLNREFGPHCYQFNFERETVCTPKQVGVREITERVTDNPERAAALQAQLDELYEEVVVKTEPILEYECPESLLRAA